VKAVTLLVGWEYSGEHDFVAKILSSVSFARGCRASQCSLFCLAKSIPCCRVLPRATTCYRLCEAKQQILPLAAAAGSRYAALLEQGPAGRSRSKYEKYGNVAIQRRPVL
jgi:hypothetical protein